MSSSFSRRQLFKLRLGDVGNLVRQARQSLAEEQATPTDSPPETNSTEAPPETLSIIRPPGAQPDEDTFLAACERCHACADACPHPDVTRFFTASDGKLEATPFLTPSEAPCRWCYDTPCITACPSDALQLPRTDSDHPNSPPPIAKAEINLDTCLNTQGTLCDTCSLMCPPHLKAIKMINRQPQIDPNICTGCGMCAYYCESDPTSITITPL
ncbi:MAG: hypothetical protein L3J39_18620 [Verrucomicrobiales bacterium]|nr:hypothetical protein [Verrucomicrobiales bacterium]